MILYREDYQFQQLISFVQLDEYYSDTKTKPLRNQSYRHNGPTHRHSTLHFDEDGRLLSCLTDNGQTEEVHCHYWDGLLIKRIFTAQNGEIHREENRVYNEQKLLVEKNVIEDGTIQKRIRYRYNTEFQLMEEEDLKNIRRYFYNEAGLCYEEHLYTDEEHTRSILYHYDSDHNMTELWEESPPGQTCRLHKYEYNQHQLLCAYQLINQDGLVLKHLEYKYRNFIEQDWLERYTWKISGRSGKLAYNLVHSCFRSPCLKQEYYQEWYFRPNFKTMELPEGTYHGQTRVSIMHGQGRLDFFDGSYYIGRFDTGRMEGYGSFYWPDGRVYHGYFESNKMEGAGNYYLADGSLYRGTFSEGQLLSGVPYYYLAGNSPQSKQNRRGRNLTSDLTQQTKKINRNDKEFIEQATKAVQQKLKKKALLKTHNPAVASINSTIESSSNYAMDLLETEQSTITTIKWVKNFSNLDGNTPDSQNKNLANSYPADSTEEYYPIPAHSSTHNCPNNHPTVPQQSN